jgi:hypothetical protein
MQTCVSNHPNCSQFQRESTNTSDRPSRILEIDGDRLKLRNHDITQEQYTYLTLSHMWGSDPAHQLVLKEANLTQYQGGIPFETLPAIYKEAVTMTRLLGYKYLWIDSLCIIQDSPSDWESEASRMASTYGNALCNLACILPPDDFHPEWRLDPRAYIPCVIRPTTTETSGLYAIPENIYSRSFSQGFACKWHRPVDWPLSSRAW